MRKITGFGLLFLCFISCDSNRIFDEYQSIDENTWLKDRIVNFELAVEDTVSKNNFFLNEQNKSYSFLLRFHLQADFFIKL